MSVSSLNKPNSIYRIYRMKLKNEQAVQDVEDEQAERDDIGLLLTPGNVTSGMTSHRPPNHAPEALNTLLESDQIITREIKDDNRVLYAGSNNVVLMYYNMTPKQLKQKLIGKEIIFLSYRIYVYSKLGSNLCRHLFQIFIPCQ